MSAILSEFLGRLSNFFVDSVWGFFARRVGYIHNLRGNLSRVKTTLEELTEKKKEVMGRVLVEEQQQQKTRLEVVGSWFKRVEEAVADGQALIRSGDQNLEKLCLGGYCSKSCWSTSIFGQQVEEFLSNELRDLKEKQFGEVTREKTAAELVSQLPCNPTVGLKTKLDEVWSCLEDKDVVGLYGIGGVGKTTLLTQIHNKFVDTKNHNILVIWVVVGRDARPEKIQEGIGRKTGFSNEQWGSPEAAQKIFNRLRQDKFVLFLDDLWERIDLGKIGIPSREEQMKGSKIIFSTRSSKVCSEMRAHGIIRVETLEWVDAWELFEEHAGKDTINFDPEIPPLAMRVAEKCSGLPIALKTIGRAMSGKLDPREWQHAIHIMKEPSRYVEGKKVDDQLLIDIEVEVFLLLRYSYDNLSSDKLKACFLYCALFPDDFAISKEELIEYWICENFWNGNFTTEAYNEAYSIIGTLVRSCLLEDEGEFVKMHDVIRDMALWIEKDNVLVIAGAQSEEAPRVEKYERVRRLSLMSNKIEKLTEEPRCANLETLLLQKNEKLHEVNEEFFKYMGALTVLNLSGTNLRKLPKSIEKLVSLQYLNLSRTRIEELPVELAKLCKLKYLDVSGLKLKAKRSEGVISGLSSLQVLKMTGCSYSYEEEEAFGELSPDAHINMLLDELRCLELLKELYVTVNSLERLNIMTRKLLAAIKGVLLQYLEGLKSLNICLLANMENLSELRIRSCDLEEMHYIVDSAVGSSSTYRHMKTDISFSCLRDVTVARCNYLKDLTWLVLLPNLTYLTVHVCWRMEEIISIGGVKLRAEVVDNDIINQGKADDKPFFSKLRRLELYDLPQLRCIYQNALPFPLLSCLVVFDCPLLKKLPLDSNSRGGPKIQLYGDKAWWERVEAVMLPRFKF